MKLKITRDSSANYKILKKLVEDNFIELYDVPLEENSREYTKTKNKVLPIGVFGYSRFGESIFSDDSSIYKRLVDLIGKNNIKDCILLEAHYRNGNDYFVTEDKNDILNNKEILFSLFGIKVIHTEDLDKNFFVGLR